MKTPPVVDFETRGIEGRPKYPPEPAGVAVKLPGRKSRYYAWGHPEGNNCTKGQGREAVREAYSHGVVLMHNAKFDVDVAYVHLGLKPPPEVHDTLYLLFLDDPHQRELSLKPSAERILGLKPEERDAVADWLLTNQPLKHQGITITSGKQGEHFWARYICLAPASVVGPYACGDVDRTGDLFEHLYEDVCVKRGMREAYDRERRLMPIILESERQGVRVDTKRLARDVAAGRQTHERVSQWVRKSLKCGESVNLDSGSQLVEALLASGKADESQLELTPKSKPEKPTYKTDRASLDALVGDVRLKAALRYRTQLGTCLGTFMEPWLKVAMESGGLIFTNWNQTKGDGGGTRTGRLSSTPNFQNIPNFHSEATFVQIFKEHGPDKKKPAALWPGMPPLEDVRQYVVPWERGHVLMDRDYSQQELRALGHFEGGPLMEMYHADPWLDVHQTARELIIKLTGREWARKPVKNTGFGIIYGMGVGLLAERSNLTQQEAQELKNSYLAIFPGLKGLQQEMKARSRANQPIRTWGGREYYCEPPAIIKGRIVQFDYKMINVLIQGSCADATKEAIVRYDAVKHDEVRFLLNIHDELCYSGPRKLLWDEMKKLKDCMQSVEFDVPMFSEGEWSDQNWAELKPFDKKGEVVYRGR